MNLYIISGERAVHGALSDNRHEIRYLLATAEKSDQAHQLKEEQDTLNDVPGYRLSDDEFRYLSDERTPQGIALVCTKPDTRLTIDMDPGKRLIFLDRVSDPGNLGTILRTALWFGIDGVLLSADSADPFQGKTVRSSAGAITGISIYENISTHMLEQLKARFGYTLLATVVKGGTSPDTLGSIKRQILLFGSEASGLDPQFIERSDHMLTISRPGSGESLNLAVAVGLFLYELVHQKS